jgi:hypothetical protein
MSSGSDTLLDSWKAIAKYLGRDVRTVRRWEKKGGLPVHRALGRERGTVYAYRSELDTWLRGSEGGAGNHPVSAFGKGSSGSLVTDFAPQVAPSSEREPFTGSHNDTSAPKAIAPKAADGSATSQGIIITRRHRWWLAGLTALATVALAVFGVSWRSRMPQVLSVAFTGAEGNLGLDIAGMNFGQIPTHLPLAGDIPWFRIGDVTCFAAKPGECEAGFARNDSARDDYTLNYISWSDNRILIGNYSVASVGDAVEIGIWNAQSRNPQDVAIWAGNVGGAKEGTPHISKVTFRGAGKDLHFIIEGSGFGEAPAGVPGVGNTAFLSFGNYACDSQSIEFSALFRAGFQNARIASTITLVYESWSDTKIEIGGFEGAYGQNGLVVRHGDPIAIDVWSTKTHLATAWGGRIP